MSITISDIEGKEWAEGYRAGMRDAVIHAHWIVEKESDSFGDHYRTYYTCSRCNHITFKGWNFCPDCGAKMDEVVE